MIGMSASSQAVGATGAPPRDDPNDPFPHAKAGDDEDREAAGFDHGEQILHHATGPEAEDVDDRHHGDQRERNQRLRREAERDDAERQREVGRRIGGERDEAAEEAGESDGRGRDGAGEAGDERGPPREKAGSWSERFLEIDVFPAGSGLSAASSA